MWYRILKKDLKKRKGINMILFIFIILSTLFFASSLNNILVVSGGIRYYMDYANVADVQIYMNGASEKEQVENWAENLPDTKEYTYEKLLQVKGDDITVKRDGKSVKYKTGGSTTSLGTADSRYCIPYDQDGQKLTLREGEIALPRSAMVRNKLKVGDEITIPSGGLVKTFTIVCQTKDIVFGNDFAGNLRFVLSAGDYEQFEKEDTLEFWGVHYIITQNVKQTVQSFNNQGFQTSMNVITRSTFNLMYVFDMIIAALLIFIGICLILISLFVLRFALVFTLEENYREIGVMKALGLRNLSIQKIYLLKYLLMVTVGAVTGGMISVPVGNAMVKSVSENIIMEDGRNYLWANLLCVVAVVVIVMGFCYLCTGKLKKVSAVQAIRSGKSGERYRRRKGLLLYKRKWMPVTVFLGMNDILSHVKRYAILMLTFCISFILISIPLNSLTTIQSDEMAEKFTMDPDAAVYLERLERKGEDSYNTVSQIKEGIKRVEGELAEKGYDAELTGGVLYFWEYRKKETDNYVRLLTIQLIGPDNDFQTYTDGDAPRLENEIAFSRKVMEENDWQVGDKVEIERGTEKKEFIITGVYSDYMQLGESARLNPVVDMEGEVLFDYWKTMVNMDIDLSQREMMKKMKEEFPEYEWTTAQKVVDFNVGNVKDSLKAIQIPMTGLLCGIIMLIVTLMEKLFIVREKGEIAMMKSVGFKNRDIRIWQIMRMIWVVLFSMIPAVPLSVLSNRFVLTPIFAIMGAELKIQVDILRAYVIYPGILLIGIIVAVVFATRGIRKIDIREAGAVE